jgi:hypothetical protein
MLITVNLLYHLSELIFALLLVDKNADAPQNPMSIKTKVKYSLNAIILVYCCCWNPFVGCYDFFSFNHSG